MIVKCLEGLYISCYELNEITKNAVATNHSTHNSNSRSTSIDASQQPPPPQLQPSRASILHSIESMERVNDIYLFIINLLIMVQDSSLLEIIVTKTIIIPKWFKERANVEV